ncbi:MAG: DUF1289 domain-containing protein [Pseudomonadota bacterium]
MVKKAAKPKRRWRDAPSPCIDVCKYPDAGPCKGCGMLKKEKKGFKKLRGKAERKPFLESLVARLQAQKGKRLERWLSVYRRKCAKKGVPCPLDKVALPGGKT